MSKICSVKNCKKLISSKGYCKTHYAIEWTKKNSEKVSISQIKYYKKNKSKILKKVKKYQKKNHEKILKRKMEYYIENRTKILKLKKERRPNSKK